MMRYNTIRSIDISNGEGIACSIFLQGCSHHCKNCFNPETWDFTKGKELTPNIQERFIELCKSSYIDCISILGGEPFDQQDIYNFIKYLHSNVNKPIYIWSGYTYEELLKIPYAKKCFDENLIYCLIDGKFIEEQKNLNLKLRGSKNQRILYFNNKLS